MASVEERLVEVLQRVARKDLYWLLEETLVPMNKGALRRTWSLVKQDKMLSR